MTILHLPQAGQYGIIKDLSQHEMPPNAWTDGNNVQFIDGYVKQADGYGLIRTTTYDPEHLNPMHGGTNGYLVYASGSFIRVIQSASTETDISGSVTLNGSPGVWTSCNLGDSVIFNDGHGSGTTNPPVYWNGNIATSFQTLSNWQSGYSCGAMRSYKNFLVAMYIKKSGTTYPYMVKWSHPADPGALPASWDQTDASKDAGEFDIAEGGDYVLDGMQLRDTFLIGKESSIWKMTYTGGQYVHSFQKISGQVGLLAKRGMVDFGGTMLIVGQNDIVICDGQNIKSILDRQSRSNFYNTINYSLRFKTCVCENTNNKEIYIAYPTSGQSDVRNALVWNYAENTFSFRDLPSPTNHIAYGFATYGTGRNEYKSNYDNMFIARGGATKTVLLLDYSADFNGTAISSYIERIGLSFGQPDKRKYIKRIMPRIRGTAGQTMTVKVGSSFDPYTVPTNYQSQTFTIGSTESCHYTVDGRYIGIKIENGTATDWRLDSMSIDYELSGDY